MSDILFALDAFERLLAASKQAPVNFGFAAGKKPEDTILVFHKQKSGENLAVQAKQREGATAKVAHGTAETKGKLVTLKCDAYTPGMKKSLKGFFKKRGLSLKANIVPPPGAEVDPDDLVQERESDEDAPTQPSAAQPTTSPPSAASDTYSTTPNAARAPSDTYSTTPSAARAPSDTYSTTPSAARTPSDTYSTTPNAARSNRASPTQPPPASAPPRQPQAAPVAQPLDPRDAEFQQLSKQVEDDFYKLARMLPDVLAQDWKERLVAAGNKTRQKPPDYAAAITELKQIQQDLAKERGPLERAAFDENCKKFNKRFVQEGLPLLGEKADPFAKGYLKALEDVQSGKLTPDKANPVVVKLQRDLEAKLEKRRLAILAVIADYERIMPIVSRAEAVIPKQVNAPEPQPAPENVRSGLAKLDKFLKRVPIIKQFFPKGSALNAPPPPPPSLTSVKEAVAKGFKEGFQTGDLEELKERLAELEKLAIEALKNMDLEGQLDALDDNLPVPASLLELTDKELGSGNYATTYVVNGQGVKPMAAKVLRSSKPEDIANFNHEEEVYARLGDHPNIVKCYGKQQIPGGKTAIVMELVEGDTAQKVFNKLADRYNREEISREEYLGAMQHMIHGILMGLAHFEALGLSHRDIKGDNVLFDPVTNEPKIFDMGLGKEHGPQDQAELPIKWTPPEGVTGKQIGPEWDSFGLGQTVHQQLERNRGGEKASAPDAEAPWKVQSQKGKIHDGNIFVPGQGSQPFQSVDAQQFFAGDVKALDSEGRPTVMPLTKGSDKKTGGEVPGALAPAAAPGKYGAETAYVDFMNRLMHPDPAKRMPPSEALRHPFMTDRLLSSEQVAQVISPAKDGSADGAAEYGRTPEEPQNPVPPNAYSTTPTKPPSHSATTAQSAPPQSTYSQTPIKPPSYSASTVQNPAPEPISSATYSQTPTKPPE